jgi:2-keto-3-deoxy-galactonokinase
VWVKAISSGVGINDAVVQSGLASIRKQVLSELQGTGMSNAQAVRLLQEVESSVNREARAFGGPITESDRAAARISSGISSGRVDLLFARQVRQRAQELDGIIAEATINGNIKSSTDAEGTVTITSDNALSKQLKRMLEETKKAQARVEAMSKAFAGVTADVGSPSATVELPTVIKVDAAGNPIQ